MPHHLKTMSAEARRDAVLRRALLMLGRGKPDVARQLLETLPRDPDVDDLLARVHAGRNRDKSALLRLRDLRYQFHLDTSARRAGAYVVAAGAAIYGAWEVGKAGAYASANGLAAAITTQVDVGGRYTTRMVDWTRPIWLDLVYGAAFLVAGVLAALFVWRVARGAADWEELGASDSDWRDRSPSGWW